MLSTAQQRREFRALGLAEFDPIAYLLISDGRRESLCKNLHA